MGCVQQNRDPVEIVVMKLLVPIDGSKNSDRAVKFAAQLAARLDGSALLLHVLGGVPARKELKRYLKALKAYDVQDDAEIESVEQVLAKSGEDEGSKLLERANRIFRKAGGKRSKTALEGGDPATVMLRYAESKKFDMVVMGRRGHGKLKSILMGSLSQKVASLAICPVLTIK